MRVWTESYGCTLNQGETAMVLDMAMRTGHTMARTLEESDLVIFGSCVVIDQTERKMWRRIQEFSGKRLMVVGCLPQVYMEKLLSLVPDALVIPPGDMEEAANFFSQCDVEPVLEGVSSTIPISTGCLGECTYCLTRVARGPLRSRQISEVLGWAELAVKRGARELRLSSQDNGAYGWDIGADLPLLLENLEKLEGDFFVRIGMMNPSTAIPIREGVAKFLMGPKAFRFLHIPIQSGSDTVLKKMGRDYLSTDAVRLVEEFRRDVADLTISTDVIVGFPGETEEDHRATLEMVKHLEPDILNVTRFSPRPNTPAYDLPPNIAGGTVKERSRQLTSLRLSITREKKKRWLGRTVEALVVENRGEQAFARTRNYLPLILESREVPGTILRARVVSTDTLHLLGERI